MTLKEFFRRARKRKWSLQPGLWGGRLVRCKKSLCPLVAVAGMRENTDWEDAARKLRIRWDTAVRIVDAADNHEHVRRRWLLKNLGVKS